jgi:hypothetical protein
MVAHAAAVQQPVAVALEHRACLSGGVRGGGGGGGGVSAVSVLKGVHIHDLSHFHNHYTPFEARPFLFVRFFCICVISHRAKIRRSSGLFMFCITVV